MYALFFIDLSTKLRDINSASVLFSCSILINTLFAIIFSPLCINRQQFKKKYSKIFEIICKFLLRCCTYMCNTWQNCFKECFINKNSEVSCKGGLIC